MPSVAGARRVQAVSDGSNSQLDDTEGLPLGRVAVTGGRQLSSTADVRLSLAGGWLHLVLRAAAGFSVGARGHAARAGRATAL